MLDEELPGPAGDDAAWLATSVAIYVPVTIASVGWVAWRLGGGEAWARQVGADPLIWGTIAVLLGLGLAVGSQVLSRNVPRLGEMSDALAVQIGNLSPATTLAMAVLSSVGEEWVFRGVLQPAWGWPFATLLFAVVHVPVERQLWAWPFLAGAMGLLMAALFELSGGLVAPIALHFAINALNLRWLARRSTELRRGRAA